METVKLPIDRSLLFSDTCPTSSVISALTPPAHKTTVRQQPVLEEIGAPLPAAPPSPFPGSANSGLV